MTEWREFELGSAIRTNESSVGASYPFEEILYLDTGSITKGKIDELQKISISNAPSRAKRLVKDGDVVYSSVRPIQRHYGYISNPPINLVVSTGFVVISCDNERVDSKFLYYYLTSDSIVEELDIIAEASTSTYPSLKPSDIEKLNVCFPARLEEQKTIAAVLSSLDDKIDLLHRQNQTLEAMAEILFRQWFVEEAQEDWEVEKLGECVTISYGKNLPTKNLLEEGFPVFGANGQIGFFDRYTYENPQVLVSCRGEASGKVNVSLPKSFITNNSLVLERNKKLEISFEYLKYWAYSYDFNLHVSGSAQPQITIDGLYDAGFLRPDAQSILKFTDMVRPIEKKRHSNALQISTLEKLRDTVLPKLMSGEVRVDYA